MVSIAQNLRQYCLHQIGANALLLWEYFILRDGLCYNFIDAFSAIREILEKRAVIPEIKARIRYEIIQELEDAHERQSDVINENVIINALISEYLKFNNYKYTADVFNVGK